MHDQSNREKRKKGIDRDESNSDDDDFYDRTDKLKKKQKLEKNQPNLLTPEMLYSQRYICV